VARLYSNENFPFPVVRKLRELGHDVATIQEQGRANESLSDPAVLQLATSQQRAVLTLNRLDFLKLHRQSASHSGIIVCTVDPDFDAQATRIHEAIHECDELTGQLFRVNRTAKG